MPSTLPNLAADDRDPLDGWELPDHWSEEARDTFANVLSQRPDLDGADLSQLMQAAELVDYAGKLGAVAARAGYEATGSMGQTVVHGAATEARQARTAAAAILARLSPTETRAQTRSRANLRRGRA
ncbi:hypothetical protein [Curtobacterium sp. MCBD17_019]|uniref:hypothetical protein n=1 Tax=Curtobacterium sp. MCBD17_019 TaxID=2175669 RepID=UPI000DA7EA03|nr:hypothetical protein [Curtobacterium sp. MCBD17_019]PZE71619.1 hypothetical protein DEI82_15135 [Curtobacterium sp. MCBD17_019]